MGFFSKPKYALKTLRKFVKATRLTSKQLLEISSSVLDACDDVCCLDHNQLLLRAFGIIEKLDDLTCKC